MAVAKGATIPKERLLDAVNATQHALEAFAKWAHVKASDPIVVNATELELVLTSEDGVEVYPVDAMQIRLAAWQADRFGNVPHSDAHMALGVIEELGEGFDEDATAEDSIDALGDVMIYASQLCTANRLAIRPVIELGVHYVRGNLCHNHAISIGGMLAHVVLKHEQNIRGLGPAEAYRPRLVDALALMIAKALEDCTVGHELDVNPFGVFEVIGKEILARKQGDAMIPGSAPVVAAISELEVATTPFERVEERKAAALGQLQDGAELLEKAAEAEPGNFRVELDRYGQPIAIDE